MSPYVTDDIGAVVTRMQGLDISYGSGMISYLDNQSMSDSNRLLAPFYMYGHRKEIANTLLEMNVDKVRKYQKYPLVALRMDIPEPYVNGITELRLNIIIAAYTDKNWNAEERMTNVFKPVLYPLYKRFLEELWKGGEFFWQGSKIPDHTKIDRPYWGTAGTEGNVKYIFSDPLDVIEIIDLKIKKNFKHC